MSVEPILRLATCIGKIQEQLEKMAAMQNESTMTVNKLSGAVLHLSQEIGGIKTRMDLIERGQKDLIDRQMSRSLVESKEIMTPLLSDPTCDPMELFGPLTSRRSRVLLVEDDATYQWLVSRHLEARGIDCVLAPTAHDALLSLRNEGGFDLVLMDIHLPGGLSGLDATQRIRKFDRNIPIVSMTSSTAPKQVASYLAGGMNDVLSKPFSRDNLLNLVTRFCALNIGTTSESRGASLSCIEEVPNPELAESFGSQRGGRFNWSI